MKSGPASAAFSAICNPARSSSSDFWIVCTIRQSSPAMRHVLWVESKPGWSISRSTDSTSRYFANNSPEAWDRARIFCRRSARRRTRFPPRPCRIESAKAVGNGHPAVASEGAGSDLHARRGLPALVFIDVDQFDDPLNDGPIKSQFEHLRVAAIFLDIRPEYRIQHII